MTRAINRWVITHIRDDHKKGTSNKLILDIENLKRVRIRIGNGAFDAGYNYGIRGRAIIIRVQPDTHTNTIAILFTCT